MAVSSHRQDCGTYQPALAEMVKTSIGIGKRIEGDRCVDPDLRKRNFCRFCEFPGSSRFLRKAEAASDQTGMGISG
jgi:hypothetical protein